MRGLVVLVSVGICCAVVYLVNVAGTVDMDFAPPKRMLSQAEAASISESVDRVNQWLRTEWTNEGVTSTSPADELTILRRLSLSLLGTIPSLEEIRAFEADRLPDRIARWTDRMLADPRFADYFSERLARSLVGVEEGPFIVFRRDQLTDWLSRQLQADSPWTDMAQQMIAAEGLWTDRPQANFITVARVEDEGLDVNKLAGRTVRTFLGQRMDCAQCHDHPFDERWKQADFEGLAAWFAGARITIGGVTDTPPANTEPAVYRIAEPGQSEEEGRIVDPAVPFHPEWLPQSGTARHRLSVWTTHPQNRRFERAIANRIWGLMFGRSYYDPVDDLPHPPEEDSGDTADDDLLDVLGQGFRQHGSTLGNLIRVIAQSDAFQLSSSSDYATVEEFRRQENAWAVFPLIRLRPEQVIGSLFQASSVRTIDQNSHVFIRFQRFTSESDFLQEYGDLGDEELLQQVGTIPQALLRMNGRFTRELSQSEGFHAAAQVMRYSPDDPTLIDNCFLTCLTRRPAPDEQQFFVDLLSTSHEPAGLPDTSTAVSATPEQQKPQAENPQTQNPEQESAAADDARPAELDGQGLTNRQQIVQDIFWTLFNSPEFSWNH